MPEMILKEELKLTRTEKVFKLRAKVIYNKRVTGNYFRCGLHAPGIASGVLPGQFVNIKVSECIEPLLRRPFSVHRVKGSSIEILYEVLGNGTEILSQRKPGECLDMIGPLGNGFDLRGAAKDKRKVLLVAGGMGVAPLLFLAERLIASSKSKAKPIILIGAKSKSHIVCANEFRKMGCDVKIATDDGSAAFKGYVTDLLKKVLPLAISDTCFSPGKERLTIYACGPKPMLKKISELCARLKVSVQLSLEEHMACGIGACLGCIVDTVHGYKRVCKEGPVFDASDIIWE